MRHNKNRRNSEIEKIKKKIEKMGSLKELRVEEFAPEGGYADKIAKEIKEMKECELKPTQLRKFFDELKNIQRELKIGKNWDEVKNRVILLTPVMAYASARKVGGKELIPESFYKLISTCIKKIKEREDFETFVEFFESIVAYHKYYQHYHEKSKSKHKRGF